MKWNYVYKSHTLFVVDPKQQCVPVRIVLVLQFEAGSVYELDGIFVHQYVCNRSSYNVRSTEPVSHHIGEFLLGELVHCPELLVLCRVVEDLSEYFFGVSVEHAAICLYSFAAGAPLKVKGPRVLARGPARKQFQSDGNNNYFLLNRPLIIPMILVMKFPALMASSTSPCAAQQPVGSLFWQVLYPSPLAASSGFL